MTADVERPPSAEFERQPPQDIQAEQSVLGGMLLSKDAITDVIEVLRDSGDFYRPAHQIVYDTIRSLYDREKPTDPVTVSAELTRSGQLMRVGGAPYLHTLISSVPTAANAGYYAEIVAERAVLRRLVEAGTRIVQLGYGAAGQGGGPEIEDVGQRARTTLDTALDGSNTTGAVRLGDFYPTAFNEFDAVQTSAEAGVTPSGGLYSGIKDLDKLTNGFKPGQLIVVAARPAIGKSTLALGFNRHVSVVLGIPTLFFSLEMTGMELAQKVLSAEAKVPLHNMLSGHMNDDEWARLARRMGEIADKPMYVDDSATGTFGDLYTQAHRMVRRHGVQQIVVDYLQLMGGGGGKRAENRQTEVAGMSRALKLLAKKLHVPVIAVSQVNRGPEQRQDKRPMLADLRESGAIEQDADMVLLLHREDAYERESPRAGEADLILAKHRNGPTGIVTVAFQGHYSRFVDMAA